jgi:hypothetical protein
VDNNLRGSSSDIPTEKPPLKKAEPEVPQAASTDSVGDTTTGKKEVHVSEGKETCEGGRSETSRIIGEVMSPFSFVFAV